MKKKIIFVIALLSATAFATPFKGMNSNSSEKLVSERLEKLIIEKTVNTNGEEKGDADIKDNVPEAEVNIRPNLSELNQNLNRGRRYTTIVSSKQAMLENALNRLLDASYSYLDVPYLWGGTTRKGLDCSAFVKNAYSYLGVVLPRVSRQQAQIGRSVSLSSIRKGDLMFFYTDSSRPHTVTHVGMYIGNGKIIHASSSNHRVVIANLQNGYFLNKLAGIKRIIDINA